MNNTEPKHISEFILKWQKSLPQTMRSEFEYDTHALMNQKEKQPQPELNEIERAFHEGVKVRRKIWQKDWWMQKHSENQSINQHGVLEGLRWVKHTNFNDWELYHEPTEQSEKPRSQAKLDNSFDRERFERLFCAVTVSLPKETWDYTIQATQRGIDKLDAFYASQKGGSNG